MSLVTDACLYASYIPREAEAELLLPLPFDERHQSFRKVPWEASGGTKVMGADVYLAGFNYVLPSDLIDYLRQVLGNRCEAVLVVEMEGDEQPRVERFSFDPAPTSAHNHPSNVGETWRMWARS